MVTTIQISNELKDALNKMKIGGDTYEDIIWDLLEDRMELSEETKKAIEEAQKNIKDGKVVSLEDIKKKYRK